MELISIQLALRNLAILIQIPPPGDLGVLSGVLLLPVPLSSTLSTSDPSHIELLIIEISKFADT